MKTSQYHSFHHKLNFFRLRKQENSIKRPKNEYQIFLFFLKDIYMSRVKICLKIVKQSGLFNRDMRVVCTKFKTSWDIF